MIRRPFAFLCGAYLFGAVTELFLTINDKIIIAIPVIILVCSILLRYKLIQRKNNRDRDFYRFLCLFFVAVVLAAAGAFHFSTEWNRAGSMVDLCGEYVTISGQVLSVQEKDSENHKLTVAVKEVKTDRGITRPEKQEKLLISVYGQCSKYYTWQGRSITVTGLIEMPSGRRNPKAFDYSQYLKTKGIRTIMAVPSESVIVSERIENPYLNWASKVKHIFSQNLYACFEPELAGLMKGMVFGDSSGLEEELYEEFQKNGVCHILAVSGLHVGALYMCLNVMMGKRRQPIACAAIAAVLFFYALLANFSPSVVRAVIMIALHMAARLLYCRYDMFTASMATMLVMTVQNPMILMNLGFQLSFTAIFTLSIVLPAALRLWDRGVIVTPIVIQAGIAPISAYAFNYISFSAFLANIPVVFLGGILIPLGMLLLIFSLGNMVLGQFVFISSILSALFQITGICTEFFLKLLLFINNISFIEGISYKYVVSPPVWLILFYYAGLFFVSSELFRILFQRGYLKRILMLVTALLMVTIIFGDSVKDGFEKAQIIFLDVGQGDCMLIRDESGKTVLIDSGGSSQYDVGKKTLLPCLLKNGVNKIDLAVISHFHTDHAGGLSTLSKYMKIGKVAMYEGNAVIAKEISEKIGVKEEDFIYMAEGDGLRLSPSLSIKALYPAGRELEEYKILAADKKDENAFCLVTRIDYMGVSILMTGDLDMEGEKKLLEINAGERVKCHILKVAHHGSKYGSSEEFLQEAAPRAAVIQVGKNTYGHPNGKTIERLKETGSNIYRNDRQGAIGVEIIKKGYKIQTMIHEPKMI